MSLTYRDSKNAIPIAKIRGSKELIYLLPNSEVFSDIPIKNVKEATYKCPYCKKIISTKQNYIYHIKHEGVCKKKHIHSDYTNEIKTDELEEIVKLPLDDHEIIFVSGPPKSGKSYWVNEYVKMYKKIFDERKVVLFTRLNEDDTLKADEDLYMRITIDKNLINEKLKLDDLANSLVIFDDIESSEYPKVTKYLYSLMNDIIKNGRHANISVIITNHDLRGGQKTRDILMNMTMLVIFPQSGSVYHLTRCLHDYIGLSKSQMDKILNIKSRWVAISREFPQYIIYQRGVYMLKSTI